MKKASLALVAIALALTACGGSKKAETAAETKTASVETAAEGTEASKEAADKTEAAQTPTVAETVVLDREGLKITAKELDMNGSLGPSLKLLIENGTEQNVTVQIRDMSVNGYMIAPLFSSAVGKGETKEDGVGFSPRALKLSGIETAKRSINFMSPSRLRYGHRRQRAIKSASMTAEPWHTRVRALKSL